MQRLVSLITAGVVCLAACADDGSDDGTMNGNTGDTSPVTGGAGNMPTGTGTTPTGTGTGTTPTGTGTGTTPTGTGTGTTPTGTGTTPTGTGTTPTGSDAGTPSGTGTPPAGSDAGTTPAGSDAGTMPPATQAAQRPCISAGNQVVFIGDSYSNYAIAHRPLADFMEELARPAGALGARDNYRDLAVAGTTLASGSAAIQGQWRNAKSMKPIHVVVMDGGGNDVLIDNQACRAEGSEMMPQCQKVVMNSLNAAKKMWDDMKASGVTDVLFFWYPHIPGGLLTGFQKGTSISDWTYPMLVDAAAAASSDTFHVQMVPTVDIFEGHPEYFYAPDGLHANDKGEAKIAEAIWAVMKDQCIGQAEASGCCKP